MAVVKITVNNHGSLKVTGDFEICDGQGQLFDLAGRETIGLCRCGYSQNKPFCDGSHKNTKFTPVKLEVCHRQSQNLNRVS